MPHGEIGRMAPEGHGFISLYQLPPRVGDLRKPPYLSETSAGDETENVCPSKLHASLFVFPLEREA